MDLKNPVLLGPVAEPGAPHERRRRAPQQFQRAHPAASSRRPTREFGRLTGRHYGLVHRIQDRGRRHGLRLARMRRGQHRRRLRLPARAAQREGRLDPHQRHPPLPRGGRHQRAAGQEERHHPRAHGRGDGRRQPAGARHPRGARQGQRGRPSSAARCPRLTPAETPAPFPRRLRHRLARFPARTHARGLRVRHRDRPAARTARAPPTARPSSSSGWTIPTPSSARTRLRCCPRGPSRCASIRSAAGA